MDEEETVRYKFFLGTACREQEVMYAAWPDIDFARGIYHIRAKPDVGFTPKKHESRDVKMPTELVEMLRKRKKHAPHQRWIFINGGGKVEGHFLEKLKRIALRAKVNCGNCTAPWTAGRYPTRKIEVTCKRHPVCEHHYLHRLRKTCASNWEAKQVPVRTIQFMLEYKSLETTMRYLGITNLDSLTDKIDAAASVAVANVGDFEPALQKYNNPVAPGANLSAPITTVGLTVALASWKCDAARSAASRRGTKALGVWHDH